MVAVQHKPGEIVKASEFTRSSMTAISKQRSSHPRREGKHFRQHELGEGPSTHSFTARHTRTGTANWAAGQVKLALHGTRATQRSNGFCCISGW